MLRAYDLWITRTFGTELGYVAQIAVPTVVGWVLGFPKLGAAVGVGMSFRSGNAVLPPR